MTDRPIYITLSGGELEKDITFNLYLAEGHARVIEGYRLFSKWRYAKWRIRKLKQKPGFKAKLALFFTSDDFLWASEWNRPQVVVMAASGDHKLVSIRCRSNDQAYRLRNQINRQLSKYSRKYQLTGWGGGTTATLEN